MVAITSFLLSAAAAATLVSAVPTYNKPTPSYEQPDTSVSAGAVTQAEADGTFAQAAASASAGVEVDGQSINANSQAAAQVGSKTYGVHKPKTTHRIIAGFNGMNIYNKDRIFADVGDLVEVHYLPKNHSVAQSSFDKPCEPINDDAIFSGFAFATAEGFAPDVFTFEVKDKNPLWFYCSQTVGSHCQTGMSFSINEKAKTGKTIEEYRKLAARTKVSISPPKPGNGGEISRAPKGSEW